MSDETKNLNETETFFYIKLFDTESDTVLLATASFSAFIQRRLRLLHLLHLHILPEGLHRLQISDPDEESARPHSLQDWHVVLQLSNGNRDIGC